MLEETEPEAAGDWDGFVANVDSITVDPVNVERWVTTIRNDPTTTIQVLNADGQLEDPKIGTEPTEDDRYATANYVALSQQLSQASVDAGIELWWNSDAQMLCEAVAP